MSHDLAHHRSAVPSRHRSAARKLPLAALALSLLPAPALAQSGNVLPTINVDTEGNKDFSGYVAPTQTTATKTKSPWVETPQSVSSIGEEQIRDQKAMKFDEIMRYTPGIRSGTFGNDNRNDWFLLRGFTSQNEAIFLDGMQLFYTSYASWKLNPFALERVDVLRGPSGSLYGGGSPGGLVNATSKRPPAEPLRFMEIGINNYGNRYLNFDLGGPLAVNTRDYGQFNYRLTGTLQNGGTQVDYAKNKLYAINPALTWRPNLETSITFLASASKTKTNGQDFLPYVGTVVPAPYGRIPTSRFTSEPAWDKYDRSQVMIGYQFERSVTDAVTFRQNARYAQVNVRLNTAYGTGYATTPAAADMSRSFFRADSDANQLNLDNQLEFKFGTGPVKHTALIGVDLKRYAIDDLGTFAGTTPLNLVNPVYGTPPSATQFSFQSYSLTQNQGGLYVQDEMKFDRFTLLLSGREDLVSTINHSRATSFSPAADYSANTSKFSGRAALSYLLPFGVSPYVTYSTSFNPIIGVNSVSNTLYVPETGKQTEVGVKYEPAGYNGHFSAAYFDLYRQNVLTTDPSNPLLSTQTGAVHSKGFEFEAVANPLPGLKLTAAYTIYDFAITDDRNPASIGKVLVGVPQDFGSAWADYTIQSGPLKGLGFGGGIRYIGKSYADLANTLVVPSYTLLDAAVHYEWDSWRAAINVNNITDKTYVSVCSSDTACFYGDRLRMTASLSRKW